MDIHAATETLERYIQNKGLRSTRERQLILEEIMRGDGHFDAEEFYTILKSKGFKVSRATVYNTLDLLVDCGLISKSRFGETHSHYEKAFGRPQHYHLICLECGEIIEFTTDRLTKIQDEVCKANAFKPQSASLQIFGACSKCQAKPGHSKKHQS
ncbi:MAG: Fur family transcriptional regulator [Bacteroidota bacterium]